MRSESPSLGIRKYDSAPEFVGNSTPDATWLHYRRAGKANVPQWPGIITVSEGDKDESI